MTKLERQAELKRAERVLGARPTHYSSDGRPCILWRDFGRGVIHAIADDRAVIRTAYGNHPTPIPPSDWEEPLLPGPNGEEAKMTHFPESVCMSIACGSLHMAANVYESKADLIARWNELATHWQKEAKP